MKVPQSLGPLSGNSANTARPQDYLSHVSPHQAARNTVTPNDLPPNQNAGAVRPIVAAPPVIPMPGGGNVTSPPPYVSIPEPKRTPRG
jgi:hypothetical protein